MLDRNHTSDCYRCICSQCQGVLVNINNIYVNWFTQSINYNYVYETVSKVVCNGFWGVSNQRCAWNVVSRICYMEVLQQEEICIGHGVINCIGIVNCCLQSITFVDSYAEQCTSIIDIPPVAFINRTTSPTTYCWQTFAYMRL